MVGCRSFDKEVLAYKAFRPELESDCFLGGKAFAKACSEIIVIWLRDCAWNDLFSRVFSVVRHDNRQHRDHRRGLIVRPKQNERPIFRFRSGL